MQGDDEPRLLYHCEQVYEAMEERAEPLNDNDAVKCYVGMLTHLFEEIGYGLSRYTRVTTMLKSMGCVEQVKRGGGSSPSRWYLYSAPTLEIFEQAKARDSMEDGLTEDDENLANRQAINSLNKRVTAVEGLIKELAPDTVVTKYGIP